MSTFSASLQAFECECGAGGQDMSENVVPFVCQHCQRHSPRPAFTGPSPGLQVLDGLVDDFSSRLIQSHPSAQLHVTDAWRKMVLEKLCDVLSALCQTSSLRQTSSDFIP